MRLHFPSVAVGVAAVAIILVSMSQSAPPAGQPRIEYGPHPRDMLQIKDGAPFLVPAGRIFVLTGLGNLTPTSPVSLKVNGVPEITTSAPAGIVGVPQGFTVAAGSTVEVYDNDFDLEARAWGYLANQ